jgi:hypothetical protein
MAFNLGEEFWDSKKIFFVEARRRLKVVAVGKR